MSRKKKKQQQRYKELAIIWGLVCICILVVLFFAWVNSRNKDNNDACSSCHKTFTNRTDTKSIAWTSMCEQCYKEFKFKQELQEEIKKHQERNK